MVRVMFICAGNTCRSQMAEGIARAIGGGFIEPCSAGVRPESSVNPYAVRVMREVGIDISGQKAKRIDPALFSKMDYVVTLCGDGDVDCPARRRTSRNIHIPVDDPVGTKGSEEQVLAAFRRTRIDIENKLRKLLSDIWISARYGL